MSRVKGFGHVDWQWSIVLGVIFVLNSKWIKILFFHTKLKMLSNLIKHRLNIFFFKNWPVSKKRLTSFDKWGVSAKAGIK